MQAAHRYLLVLGALLALTCAREAYNPDNPVQNPLLWSCAASGICETTGSTPTSTSKAVSPDQISGLEIWLKADAITGVANGGPVSPWSDSSGQGRDASPAGSCVAPLLTVSAINGMAALDFNGTSHCLQAGAMPALNNLVINWLAVFQGDTVAMGTILRGDHDPAATSGLVDALWGSLFNSNLRTHGRDTADVFTGPDAPATAGVWYLITGAWSQNDSVTLYRGGDVAGLTSGADKAPTAHVSLDIGVTHVSGAPNNYLDGRIAEIMVYSVDLTTEQRESLQCYLSEKYNLTVSHTCVN